MFYNVVSCTFHHPVAFTPPFPPSFALPADSLCFCTLPYVLFRSIIRSGGHFDTYWLVNTAESLLGENRTVIWLCKIALPQYQLYMYCNVKAHYSWPICSVWRITVQTSGCTFSLDPPAIAFIHDVPPQVCLYQQFVFNVIDSVALNSKLKAVSPI